MLVITIKSEYFIPFLILKKTFFLIFIIYHKISSEFIIFGLYSYSQFADNYNWILLKISLCI